MKRRGQPLSPIETEVVSPLIVSVQPCEPKWWTWPEPRIKAVTSNICAICCTNGRVSRSRGHRCDGLWSKRDWLRPGHTSNGCIDADAPATRHLGMLVQIDGSRHAWLGDRGPWLCLIAAIDDATGKLAAAVFREEEDAAGYFLLVQQMLEQHGRPWALYHDRHGIFQQNSLATETDTLEEQLVGKQDPTQFGRRYGRARDHFDCCSLATSQRTGGTALWHRCPIAWWPNCAWLTPGP